MKKKKIMKIFKRKMRFFLLFVLVLAIAWVAFSINDALKMKKVADAAGGLPFTFGGRITFYQPACVSDPVSGVCANCPLCSSPKGAGNFTCNGFQEIQFVPAGGTPGTKFVCLPKGYNKFLGGGAVPRVGGFILGGGASNILLSIVGISK